MVVLLIFFAFFSLADVCDWFWSTNKNYCCGCVADFALCISCFFVVWLLFVVGSDQHKSRLIHSCAVNQLEAMTAACSTSNASKSSSAGTVPHKYFRKTEKNIACEQPKLAKISQSIA